MKIGSDNGLAANRHRANTWVTGDLGQWCIYAFLGLTELIISPYWGIYRCGEKQYCLRRRGYLHTHCWKWTIPTRQVGSSRGTGWPNFVKSPIWLPCLTCSTSKYCWQYVLQRRQAIARAYVMETIFIEIDKSVLSVIQECNNWSNI